MTNEEKNRLSAVDSAYKYEINRVVDKAQKIIFWGMFISLILGLVGGFILGQTIKLI